MKGIPSNYELTRLISFPSAFETSRPGKSTVVKLEFSDTVSRAEALRHGINLRVYEFKAIPRCRNICQSPEHLQSPCSNVTPKCTGYAGPHVSDRDSPCNLSPMYVNCGGKHVSYSFTCPKLKAIASHNLPKTN